MFERFTKPSALESAQKTATSLISERGEAYYEANRDTLRENHREYNERQPYDEESVRVVYQRRLVVCEDCGGSSLKKHEFTP